MARVKVRHLVPKKNRAGDVRYYWQPPAPLRKLGWRPVRLSDAYAHAIAEAEAENAKLDAWRTGTGPGPDAAPAAGRPEPGTLAAAIDHYTESRAYQRLRPKTRRDSYDPQLARLRAWAGDKPMARLSRSDIQTLYDALAEHKPASANQLIRVASMLWQHAWRYDLLPDDKRYIVSKVRTEASKPRVRVASRDEEEAQIAAADRLGWASIADAIVLAIHSGQRQGDLLQLPRLRLRDGDLHLRQSKTGAFIRVPLTPRAAERIAARDARAAADCPQVLVHDKTGRRWGSDNFKHRFVDVRAEAATACPSLGGYWENAWGEIRHVAPPEDSNVEWRSVPALTFQDFRDTFVTRAAEAGSTIPEIAAVTGHSEGSVLSILKHYLALNSAMAAEAIRKTVVRYEQGTAEKEGQQG
jgi:hypothetical protein